MDIFKTNSEALTLYKQLKTLFFFQNHSKGVE